MGQHYMGAMTLVRAITVYGRNYLGATAMPASLPYRNDELLADSVAGNHPLVDVRWQCSDRHLILLRVDVPTPLSMAHVCAITVQGHDHFDGACLPNNCAGPRSFRWLMSAP